ncbi:MAG TPA: hypothetical protein VE754_04680 [Actinomycetota bacterium]|jgi:hypothetical protein|nr:hypothetical protein [Actinomycetota bacterium]
MKRPIARSVWDAATGPLRRVWESQDPFDDYALVHMTSAAGDALVAIALADSIFFSLPVGEAKVRVALYLVLTMAPLALAAPLMVPLLDRGGFRRLVSFIAAAGRALAAVFVASRLGSLLLFPATFVILILSRIHAITKNGLTAAYARDELVQANARLGRLAVYGVVIAMLPGFLLLQVGGPSAVIYLASVVYGLSALFNLFLHQPPERPETGVKVEARGRLAELASASAGTAGLRAAHGFLLFLVAFALREAENPTYWIGVLLATGVAGVYLGDILAPRLPRGLREEIIVLLALSSAGIGALLGFTAFGLPTLALFTGVAGLATRFGQLAFQSLMQRHAPGGAHGRVFVRYEILFQVAWVIGALLPAMLPIPFRLGLLIVGAFYLVVAFVYLARPLMFRT